MQELIKKMKIGLKKGLVSIEIVLCMNYGKFSLHLKSIYKILRRI